MVKYMVNVTIAAPWILWDLSLFPTFVWPLWKPPAGRCSPVGYTWGPARCEAAARREAMPSD